jgi:hypothetical protein
MDSLGHVPPVFLTEGAHAQALFPGKAKAGFIDSIQKAIHSSQAFDLGKAADHSSAPISASGAKLLSPAELHQLYAGTSVPAHRYLAGLLSTEVKSPSQWLPSIAKLNLSELLTAWLSTNGSTEYEQLNSIGLDVHTSRLTGVVQVKQRSGYLGGPLTAGSREFVAFWVDWGSGFQYEGTASVAVHDFNSLPAAGLEYKVFLPVNVGSHAQPGIRGARKVKVRAVLCWNTPPSTTDPCSPVVWGNSLDGLILIPPGINAISGARFSRRYTPSGFCLRAMS